MIIYYVDGKFVPSDQAFIPVDDLSVLRGFGVFDIIKTYNGKPYFFKEHIKRLVNSANKINLKLSWTTKEIENIVLETLNQNQNIDEANVRIIITGGSSSDFMTPQGNPRLLVLLTPIKKLPEDWYQKGVKIISLQLERDIPDAKSTSYIPATMALRNAKKHDAIEVLYLDRNQYALEGTTSNIFAFKNNKLVTPDINILKGITRQAIIDLTKDIFPVEERPLKFEELLKSDEVFITGTNKGIVPVINIDGIIIGTGAPGKNTQKIRDLLEKHAMGFKKSD